MTPADKSLEEAKAIYGHHPEWYPVFINKIAIALDRARLEGKKDGLELAIQVSEIRLSKIGWKGLVEPFIRDEIKKLGEK